MPYECETLPSLDAAKAYVINTEWDWGQEGTIESVEAIEPDPGVHLWRIHTPSNMWDVWQRADGSVYGEC